MKVSAFIRSYEPDMKWLQYCLRSLQKWGDPFSEVVVCVPVKDLTDFRALVATFPAKWRVVGTAEPCRTTYIQQQADKCEADLMCSGDCIMFFDSDCVLTKPIVLDDFFLGGRPKLLFRHWHEAGSGKCWAPITKEVLKSDPMGEFMCCHPAIYHRRTLAQFRNRIEGIHGKTFLEYMASLDQFSEFNAIGNFIHQHCPEDYALVRCGENDGYPRPFKQYWSRGDFPKDELEAMVLL